MLVQEQKQSWRERVSGEAARITENNGHNKDNAYKRVDVNTTGRKEKPIQERGCSGKENW